MSPLLPGDGADDDQDHVPDRGRSIKMLAIVGAVLVAGVAAVWAIVIATDDQPTGPVCGPATKAEAEELRATKTDDLVGRDPAITGVGVAQDGDDWVVELHVVPGQSPKQRLTCVDDVPIRYVDGGPGQEEEPTPEG